MNKTEKETIEFYARRIYKFGAEDAHPLASNALNNLIGYLEQI